MSLINKMLADLETRAAQNQRPEEAKPLIDGLKAANEDSHGLPRNRRRLWLIAVVAAMATGVWQWWPVMSSHVSSSMQDVRTQLAGLQQSIEHVFSTPSVDAQQTTQVPDMASPTIAEPLVPEASVAPQTTTAPAASTAIAEYLPLPAPEPDPEMKIPRVAGLVEFLDDNFNVEESLATADVSTMAQEVLSEMTANTTAGASPTLELIAKVQEKMALAPVPTVEPKQEPATRVVTEPVVTTPIEQKKASPRAVPSAVISTPRITVPEKHDMGSSTISLQEDNADRLHERAQQFVAEGRLVEAEGQWRDALQKNPQHVAARQQLAMFYANRQRMLEAQSLLEAGLAIKPNELLWRMLLARIYVDSGAAERAAGVLERGQVSGKFDADYWGLRAAVAQQLQRLPEAITSYEQAIGLRPQEGRWWIGLAIARESAGNTKGAIDAYERALRAERFPPELVNYAQQRLTGLRVR